MHRSVSVLEHTRVVTHRVGGSGPRRATVCTLPVVRDLAIAPHERVRRVGSPGLRPCSHSRVEPRAGAQSAGSVANRETTFH